ncbi:MAG: 16S rRNA (cytosine(1402)-N(4))-methyltransferase RsmH [Chthoniobacterales bacterium]
MDLLPSSFRHASPPATGEVGPKVFSHQPVLAKEVIDFLKPKNGALFFDGTLGGGGHAELLLQAGATIVGCDRDPEALAHARNRLARFGDRFSCFQSNYAEALPQLARQGIEKVDGILLDLGVSSHQLDTPERGFSFQREGPLDMRMGSSDQTAADIVNTAELSELVHIFRQYGNEPRAVAMATRIVRERHQRPIKTTTQLASLVASGIRPGPRHPATKIFQALRITVNEEIASLERALPLFSRLLVPQGRFAIITFHSLEDRIVKQFFKKYAAPEIDDPTWPAPKINSERLFTLPSPWSLVAQEEEVASNPRSRSARLRMAEKIEGLKS